MHDIDHQRRWVHSGNGMRRVMLQVLSVWLCWASTTTLAQLSEESIRNALRYSSKHNGRGMIVKERGKIRLEQYYNGYTGAPLHIYSGTKSFFGVLGVIAEEEGLLTLDERVAETIPEWQDDPRKREITIRELLNFTSGIETGFQEIYGRSSADKLTLALSFDAVRERGESFIYGPGHLQIFCELLRRKLASRGIGYEGYLRRKLIKPLGIEITRWTEDSHGNVIPSAGIYLTGRDWLKFGEMINVGGKWRGRRLVSEEALAKCFDGTPINPAFGLCFWLNSFANEPEARVVDVEEELEKEPLPENWRGACLAKGVPVDLVASLGSTFQRLYLVRSMDLIVVHHGAPGHEFRDEEFLRILFAGAEQTKQRQPRSLFPKLFKDQ